MKKIKSPECVLCQAPLDDQLHFGLKCSELLQIRSEYLDKFTECCPNLSNYLSEDKLLLILLDPYSPLVPSDIREGWRNSDEVYKLSRNYFYDIHKKREKMIEAINKNYLAQHETEDKTEIIITLYEMQ